MLTKPGIALPWLGTGSLTARQTAWLAADADSTAGMAMDHTLIGSAAESEFLIVYTYSYDPSKFSDTLTETTGAIEKAYRVCPARPGKVALHQPLRI
jgi:hypothetical protein